MQKLDKMFWIDQQKLKDITKQFEVELDQGLKKDNQNIVRSVDLGKSFWKDC